MKTLYKMSSLNSMRSALTALALFSTLASFGCKKQDAAVLVTVGGGDGFRIPQDIDTLRIDTYDLSNTRLIISQTYTLQPGTAFPFTVLLVDSGTDYSAIKIIATATLTGNNRPVAEGEADDVSLEDGKTVDATITLAAQ